MKRILILFLALITAVATAAVPYHPMKPLPKRTRPVRVIPWKTILAGGAAAGTVIAAYKISDGIEDGIKTVAKEKPEVFADTLSVLTWPIRWAAFVLFLLVYCWIWKFFIHKTTNSSKGFQK